MKTKPRLWTKTGLQQLGDLIKRSREAHGWSQRTLADYIEEQTGHRVSDSSLSGLERANREPNWNTLAIVAAAQFVLKEDGLPYTAEEFSAIASETFFNFRQEQDAVKSLRRVQVETALIDEDGFLPALTIKGARRLKNLILAEGKRRGWGEVDFVEAGCDPELYQVILAEDWFQRHPAPELVLPLAVLLPKVLSWENDNPVFGEGYYNQVSQLWEALLNGNGVALNRH